MHPKRACEPFTLNRRAALVCWIASKWPRGSASCGDCSSWAIAAAAVVLVMDVTTASLVEKTCLATNGLGSKGLEDAAAAAAAAATIDCSSLAVAAYVVDDDAAG